MRQFLVPVFILIIVALSSSNVLQLSEDHLKRHQLGLDDQNDNTFSDRYVTRNFLDDLFYKIYVDHQSSPKHSKSQLKYSKVDNNRNDDIFSIMNENYNYDGKGFRKEQWHNYPRQLDRLHDTQDVYKRNIDLDSDNIPIYKTALSQNLADVINEFDLDSNVNIDTNFDPKLPTNPLFIKIRLAYMNNDIDTNQYSDLILPELDNTKEEEKEPFMNNLSDKVINVKDKEATTSQNSETGNSAVDNKDVKKRVFSLWSRLQSLNHKGHELHHRRHFHAFYNLPDSDGRGGRTLTAEPRAILMRPPGSPLRWG